MLTAEALEGSNKPVLAGLVPATHRTIDRLRTTSGSEGWMAGTIPAKTVKTERPERLFSAATGIRPSLDPASIPQPVHRTRQAGLAGAQVSLALNQAAISSSLTRPAASASTTWMASALSNANGQPLLARKTRATIQAARLLPSAKP